MNFDERIRGSFRHLRKKKVFVFGTFLVNISVKFYLIYMIKKMIDLLTGKNIVELTSYAYIAFALIIFLFITNFAFQLEFKKLEFTSHFDFMHVLFSGALDKKYYDNAQNSVAKDLTIIKDDSKIISNWFSIGQIVLMANSITFIGAMIMITTYSIKLAIVIFFFVAVCFTITYYISVWIGRESYEYQVSISGVSNWIIDSLAGHSDIFQLGVQSFFKTSMQDDLEHINKNTNRKLSKYTAFFNSVYGLLNNSLPFIVVIIGTFDIINDRLSIGSLIAIISLVGFLQEPVLVIPEFINERNKALAVEKRVIPFLEKESVNYGIKEIKEIKKLYFSSKGIRLYETKKILENVSFSIEKNENLLIEGESGKGKTTIFNLISRFIIDQNTNIEVNNHDIGNIDIVNYYEHILQSRQTPIIFQTTLIENILLGREYEEGYIDEILRITCLDELIEKKGYEYQIAERGANLSGGERQRIGIARTLVSCPDILLLDEPTSALNHEISKKLMDNLLEYAKERSISLIVITHDQFIKNNYCDRFKVVTI